LAKVNEVSTGSTNMTAYKALDFPPFLRDFFIRCGDVSEEGKIPLCACLIEGCNVWDDVGFTEPCPISFSENELQTRKQHFRKYRDFHSVHELAKEALGTDVEGWISLYDDFEKKQQRNNALFLEVMRRSENYNMSQEEVQ
ncbi:hypothetical protein CC86DRAFT_419501, partial [Ophiobolus disseminans]